MIVDGLKHAYHIRGRGIFLFSVATHGYITVENKNKNKKPDLHMGNALMLTKPPIDYSDGK